MLDIHVEWYNIFGFALVGEQEALPKSENSDKGQRGWRFALSNLK